MNAKKFAKSEIIMPRTAVFPMGALEVDGYDAAGCLQAQPWENSRSGEGGETAFVYHIAD